MCQNLIVCQNSRHRPTCGKRGPSHIRKCIYLNTWTNCFVCLYLWKTCNWLLLFPYFISRITLLFIPPKAEVGLCWLEKLAELPYNLRSKGKIYVTDDPIGHALVIVDNLGQLVEKYDTQNDKHVSQMAQEMESLREKVQHIQKLTHLAMTTLP